MGGVRRFRGDRSAPPGRRCAGRTPAGRQAAGTTPRRAGRRGCRRSSRRSRSSNGSPRCHPADRRRALGGRRLAQRAALRASQARDRPRPDPPRRAGRGCAARCPTVSGGWRAAPRDGSSTWRRSRAVTSRRWRRRSACRSSACRRPSGCASTPVAIRSTCGRCCPSSRSTGGTPGSRRSRRRVPSSTQIVESAVGLQPVGEIARRGLLGAGCAILPADGRGAGRLDDPVDALEEAVAVGLLQSTDKVDIWDVAFPHPLVQAAVYEHVSPTSRVRLHRAASGVGRRRRSRTAPPGRRHHAAQRRGRRGARRLRPAGDALGCLGERGVGARRGQPDERRPDGARGAPASRDRRHRQRRRSPAGLGVHAGRREVRAGTAARCGAGLPGDPARSGHRGRGAPDRRGGSGPIASADPHLAALLALRWTLHSVGRLRGAEIVEWSRRAVALVPGRRRGPARGRRDTRTRARAHGSGARRAGGLRGRCSRR